MNFIKITFLASLLSTVSVTVHAELEPLNNEAMSKIRGQAGITIDIETNLSIGEFAYKDGGSILVQGLRIGGNKNLANHSGSNQILPDRTYVYNNQ